MNALAPFEAATPAMVIARFDREAAPSPLGLGEPFLLSGGDRLGPDGIAFDLGHDWQPGFVAAVASACEAQVAAERPWFRMAPSMLIGPRGCGRTHAARMLAQAASVTHIILNISDPAIAMSVTRSFEANDALWVSPVVTAMAATTCANPVVTIVGAEQNAKAAMALIAMIDPEQGRVWNEERIGGTIDLGEVSWLVQASDASALPAPLRDLLRVVPMHDVGLRGDRAPALSLFLEVLADLGIARDDPAVGWHDIMARIDIRGFPSMASVYADLRGAVINAQYERALGERFVPDTYADPY